MKTPKESRSTRILSTEEIGRICEPFTANRRVVPVTHAQAIRRYLGVSQKQMTELMNIAFGYKWVVSDYRHMENGKGGKLARSRHLPKMLTLLIEIGKHRGYDLPDTYKWWHLDQIINPMEW